MVFGVPDPDRYRAFVTALGPLASVQTTTEAIAAGDLIILAVPNSAVSTVAHGVDNRQGEILVDATNPMTLGLAGSTVSTATSAAEQLVSTPAQLMRYVLLAEEPIQHMAIDTSRTDSITRRRRACSCSYGPGASYAAVIAARSKRCVCRDGGFMATGWAGDGAVQDQIDATIKDAIERARALGRARSGPSLSHCEECEAAIPSARQQAVPGVRLCVSCQQTQERDSGGFSGYNRRGSKDSQLR